MNRNRTHSRYGDGFAGGAELVGRVESVGPEPTFLSGIIPATQSVRMSVTEVRQGDAQVGDTVDVDVVIVAGEPNVGVGASGLPALDTTTVQPGALVAISASAADGRLLASAITTDGSSGGDTSYAGRRR